MQFLVYTCLYRRGGNCKVDVHFVIIYIMEYGIKHNQTLRMALLLFRNVNSLQLLQTSLKLRDPFVCNGTGFWPQAVARNVKPRDRACPHIFVAFYIPEGTLTKYSTSFPFHAYTDEENTASDFDILGCHSCVHCQVCSFYLPTVWGIRNPQVYLHSLCLTSAQEWQHRYHLSRSLGYIV